MPREAYTMRVAILDDYQQVAATIVDWERGLPGAEVVCFADHLRDEDQVAERLAAFDVVVAMRERTRFPRSLITRLPNLRLLVTTGMRNAAIDVAAAEEAGVVVSGT